MKKRDLLKERERLCQEAYLWESGKKATIGMPADGLRYGPRMQQAVKEIDRAIAAIDAELKQLKTEE